MSPFVGSNIIAGAAGQGGADAYQISRSLRFNSGDSSYLSRTPSSIGNRRTFTFSAWVKRSEFNSTNKQLFGSNSQWFTFYFDGSERLSVYYENSGSQYWVTNAVFRDPSAWLHVVLTVDTTEAQTADRIKIYVNGVLQSLSQTGNLPQNYEFGINTTVAHDIGIRSSENQLQLDATIAEVYFIDGQALDATAFGEFDANNVWQPKEYTHNSPTTSSFTLADNDFTWSGLRTSSANTPDSGALTDGSLNYGDTFWGNNNANGSYLDIDMTGATDGETYSIRYWNAAEAGGQTITATCKQIDSSGNDISGTSSSQTWNQGQKWNTYIQTIASNCDKIRLIFSGNSSTNGWGIGEVEVNFIPSHTNDFYLSFSDNSSNAALGTDSSGNNNDWTVNNLVASVSAPGSVNYASASNWTQTGNGLVSGTSYNNAWDGNTSGTFLNFLTNTGGNNDVAYTFPGGGVSVSSYVRLYVGAHSNNQRQWRVNNESYQSNNTTGYLQYNFSGTLTSIDGYNTWNGGNSIQLYAVEVDGTVLTYVPPETLDSLIDTPTNYEAASGNNGGNYATLNPLQKSSGSTLSNGNLDISMSSAQGTTFATMAFPASGKYYFECTATASQCDIGIAKAGASLSEYLGNNASGYGYYIDGNVYHANSSAGSGASYGSGDIIGVAFDADAGTCKWYKNNVLQVTISSLSGEWFPAFGAGSAAGIFNFGQRSFQYTPPTGFKSLCTTNLPDPTIADGSTAFDTKIYTGNGSSQTISNFLFSPDFAWFKNRATTKDPRITDTIRGTGVELYSNSTSGDYSQPQGVTAFNSDGVSVGSDGGYNGSGQGMVLWAWDAGSSNTSISAGSLNSTAYDQSQTWSSQITGTSYSGYPKTRVFNNNNTENALPADNNELVFTPSPSFSNASTVKIWYYYPSTHANAFKINGTAVGNDVAQTSTVLTHTFNVSGFTSLSWSRNKYGSEDTGIARIDVDGVQLVDSSVTVPNVPAIASTVRANPSAGFSICKWSGSDTDGYTVGHGLNAKPDLAIFKQTNQSYNWHVYHSALGATKVLRLNLTNASLDDAGFLNDTEPTSSVFTTGNWGIWDANADTVGYFFTAVEGYSAFGSYTGNGSADGPFVYTGFRPKWLMIKVTQATGNGFLDAWVMYDAVRDTYNVATQYLYANSSQAESAYGIPDLLSNGFKIRVSSTESNQDGNVYIYAAFAENPFKTARAR